MSEQVPAEARSYGKQTHSFARALFIGVICYWAVIFIATHIPTTPPQVIDHFDKILHFSAYGVLAFLLGTLMMTSFGYAFSRFFGIWIVLFGYGVADEYTQSFVPGRSADPLDLLADLCGSASGLITAYFIAKRFISRNSESADGNLPS